MRSIGEDAHLQLLCTHGGADRFNYSAWVSKHCPNIEFDEE